MFFNTLFSNNKLINHYIPALLLIVLFSSLAYINLNEVIQSIANDGKIINISGRQRMLSQKLIFLANKYHNTPSTYHEEFEKNINEIEKSHNYLLKNIVSVKLLKIYNEDGFNEDFKLFLTNLKKMLDKNDKDSLEELELSSKFILERLEKIVALNESEYRTKIQYLKDKGVLFFLGIILVILIEVLFVFYPASKKIKENTKKLEDAIKRKTRELQKSIDIISDYVIYSKTDLKGVITYASNAFCKVSGYTKQELIGKPHNIIRHPDMPKDAFKQMWKTIKAGKIWSGEVKNLKKDGGYYWVKANVSPDYDENGELIGYVGVRYDITHKKEVEKINKTLEKKISIQINKNREKDKFIFEQEKSLQLNEMIENIAHHWRQPLSVISTCVSGLILKKDLNLLEDEDLTKSLMVISDTSQKLSKTINEFGNFTRLNKKKEKFNLIELINKTINIISSSFSNSKIKINTIYEKDVIEILSIPGDLSQVMLNILNNAKDAFERNSIKDRKIDINIVNKETHIFISIQDNAGGTDEQTLTKIFDPYFTTKHKSQGTGLGLSICQTIISKQLKGKIYAQNVKNGIKFIIELPKKL